MRKNGILRLNTIIACFCLIFGISFLNFDIKNNNDNLVLIYKKESSPNTSPVELTSNELNSHLLIKTELLVIILKSIL